MKEEKKIRNILLIGRTGNGKSTVANTLLNYNNNFEEFFEESAGSVSQTKDVRVGELEILVGKDEIVNYRIIDTIGLGDTNLTPQAVLYKLAKIADETKDGLNQILLVIKGRFTREEIEVYNLLRTVIFDNEVANYTTIIRTNFPEFDNAGRCEEDRERLRDEAISSENRKLAELVMRDIIYMDNPPLVGRPKQIELNRETREMSRSALIAYLGTRQGIYKPANLDEMNERIKEFKTEEEKLQQQIQELDKRRMVQEEEFEARLKKASAEQKAELEGQRKESILHLESLKSDLERKRVEEIQALSKSYEDNLNKFKEEKETDKRIEADRHAQLLEFTKNAQNLSEKELEDLRKARKDELDLKKQELAETIRLEELRINKENERLERESREQKARLDEISSAEKAKLDAEAEQKKQEAEAIAYQLEKDKEGFIPGVLGNLFGRK